MRSFFSARSRLLRRTGAVALWLSGIVLLSLSGSGFGKSKKISTIRTATASAAQWSIVSSPNGIGTSNALIGISCVSGSDCWAVGAPNIEHWDGLAWSNVPTPPIGFLAAVACTSESNCWAVGSHTDLTTSINQTLIERWDGSAWSVFSSPNSSPTQDNLLFSVACTSANDCSAVGYINDRQAHTEQELFEHWDGTSWSVVSTSTPNQLQLRKLNAVSCVSSSDCWAVGASDDGPGQTPLTEHWNGAAWVVVPSGNLSSPTHGQLYGVNCTSSSNCFAVGQSYVSADLHTLIEHWDGIFWSIVNSPDGDATQANGLNSVWCTSLSSCWAIGYYGRPAPDYPGSPKQTLAEHWDGSSWTKVNSPNTDPTQENVLRGITCLSDSECWAVGIYDTGSSGAPYFHTLVERYAPSVQLVSTASRKIHGGAGTFDVDLASANECRSGGTNGDYTLVLKFSNPLASVGNATITSGVGTVKSSGVGTDSHEYVVNLTGVANAQTLGVSLSNVADSSGNFSATVSTSMPILIGDTNHDHFTDSVDASQTKSQSGSAATGANFREDVNVDGFIDAVDVSLVKSKSGTSLP